MQFLKTLFWVVFAVVMVLFARDNWHVVKPPIQLWGGLELDIKLPVLVLLAFLLGFVPTFIIYRARLWSMRRRLETQGQAANGPAPIPVGVPAPIRTSSAATQKGPVERPAEPPGDPREATDVRPWPTA